MAIAERLQSKWSAMELKAMKLLGAGTPVTAVATAVGVSHPRISQLLAMEDFALEVAELRYKSVEKHNALDATYDELESDLADKLKDLLPFMMKPAEVLGAIRTLNSLKRRGTAAAAGNGANNQTVVQLVIPTQILQQFTTQQFTTNINNQVIKAGEQTLETVQSGTLLSRTKQKMEGLHNEAPGTTHSIALSSNGARGEESISIPPREKELTVIAELSSSDF